MKNRARGKKQGTKVHFVSLGCPKNQVDSEVMLGILEREAVQSAEHADAIVINTCSFIKDSKEEAVEEILRAGMLKKAGKCRVLAVAGCLAQRYHADLEKSMPEVDLFLGTGEFTKIGALLRKKLEDAGGARSVVGEPEFLYDHSHPRNLLNPAHYSYIKLGEGCSNRCTYCVIPSIRGRARSRESWSVIEEAKALAAKGVKEVILISQDTTSYGRDRGEAGALSRLLRELVKINGLKWIRLLYCYPGRFDDELVNVIAGEEKVLKYIDMPIQHISDRVLKDMGRKSTGAQIRELIGELRRRIKGVHLRSSLIVGFPGESEEDFRMLMDFLADQKLERVGAFKYSREGGTPAFSMKAQVPEKVKESRWQALMELQTGISLEKNEAMLGREFKVLVDSVSEDGDAVIGRYYGQAPDIDGHVKIYRKLAPGTLVKAKVVDALLYDLVAETI
jgi:ribosomal protein S12 methylthiotransferase